MEKLDKRSEEFISLLRTAVEIPDLIEQAITAKDIAVASANFKGVWNPATNYIIGESTSIDGISYRAILDSINQDPRQTPNASWELNDIKNATITVELASDLATTPYNYKTAIVKDIKNGGIFVWSINGVTDNINVFQGNGGYWTRQAIKTTIWNVNTIADLNKVPESSETVFVKGYHAGIEGGGGMFTWDDTKIKSDHNGGTIIDPLIDFPTQWNDQVQLQAWFDGSTSTSLGCWVRKDYGMNSATLFGAYGDGIENDTIPVQSLLNNTKKGGVAYLPKKYNILKTLVFNVQGIQVLGDSTYAYGDSSVIKMDPQSLDDTLLNIQKDAIKFKNITLYGKGRTSANSKLFTTLRTDNIADIDLTFDSCLLFDVETIGILTGRGLKFLNSAISVWSQGIKLNWASTILEGANADQKTKTGFRSIEFCNNRVHAGSAGYLFWNIELNSENIWGVKVSDNYIDTDCGIWRGDCNDALFTGNKHFNNSTTPFLVQTGFEFNNVIITDNEFNGMQDDGLGNTKQYGNVLAADIVNNLRFENNIVKRCSGDCFQFVSASSKNISINNNTFSNVLIAHRVTAARYIVNLAASGISGFSFKGNNIVPSSEADLARLSGDVLLYSAGTSSHSLIEGNHYTPTWKLSNITPTVDRRNSIATQIYDGDGLAEKIISLDFYPSAVIVNAITGTSAGATRLQLYGSATGTAQIELRNGTVAVKDTFNITDARYMLIAIP